MQKALPIISKKFLIVLMAVMLVASMILFISPGKVYGLSLEVGAGKAYTTIEAALAAALDGNTIKIYPGNYDLHKDDVTKVSDQTGWYLAITQKDITFIGVDAAGNEITSASAVAANVYSTQYTPNLSWSSQNLITVFGDNVTFRGLCIMNKVSPNKGIEVVGNNFKAENCLFAPIPTSLYSGGPDGDISQYGSGIYFNNNGATSTKTGTITNNIFKNSGVTFDSFKNNWTVNITNNIFDGNKFWSPYYYSCVGATTWANQPDFTGSSININRNKFINMASNQVLIKIRSSDPLMTGVFDATNNWWGSATPDFASILSGNVINYDPWYIDAGMTTLSNYVAPPAPPGTPVYTITASVSGNGSITPSGVFNISANAGQVYNIAPNAGASITDVLVDGSSVGPVSSYTILNVNSNRTIQAIFSGGSGGIGVLGIDESMIGVLGIANADYSGFVTRCYRSILLREPDASGLSGWVNALSGGLTGEDAASGFVYSAELAPYLTALDNTGYLNFLYSRVLGRAADLPGLNGWLSDMSGGMTRAEILVYFLNSPEWITICNAYGVTP